YKTILNKKHSFILSNGADCTYILNSNHSLNNENIKNKKCIFMFIGRLESCKGVKLVFDAWNNMKNREFTELHIVGGGSLQEYFLNIHMENFFYHGVVSEKEKQEIFSRSDVFIYPSTCDTFGISYLEAIVNGLYVIASKHMDGMIEISDKEQVTFVELNVEEITKEMERAFDRLEIYKSKREIWSNDAQKKYCWRNIIPLFYKELEKIAKS
ncbi:MAG: glycosyltransferase family 4 protein, partial [Candidatus Rehaiarchaeum fermentans]|nr:glycosyltransferase family 4 protein [Candidatus Rehaiarchaeum fermentans]